jgi:hypothetical protein
MRRVMKYRLMRRREFMKHATIAITASALGTRSALAATDAVKKAFPTLGVTTGVTLLKVARDIYPHDRLSDEFYIQAISPYDAAAAKDGALKSLLIDGTSKLDAATRVKFSLPYASVSAESDRVIVLTALEQSAFFRRLQGDLLYTLYDNKAVWPLLGYEGSSWEKGGYLHRGFDDIDWL